MSEPTQNPRCILALDLGTTTGCALRSLEGLINSGTVPEADSHKKPDCLKDSNMLAICNEFLYEPLD